MSSLSLSVYQSLNFTDHLQVITIITCVRTFPQQHHLSITDCNLTLFNLLYYSKINLENTQWKPRIPLFILKAISGKYAGLAIQNYVLENMHIMYLTYSKFIMTGGGFCLTSSLALLLRLEKGTQIADSAGSPRN